MPAIQKNIIIKSKQGLHARPAAMFVQTASKYDANVALVKDGERVNGKSIMGILTLGAQKGDVITLEVEGENAEKLAADLEILLQED